MIKQQKQAVLETTLENMNLERLDSDRIRDIERETENFLQKFRDDHMSNYMPDEDIENLIRAGKTKNSSQVDDIDDSDEEIFRNKVKNEF